MHLLSTSALTTFLFASSVFAAVAPKKEDGVPTNVTGTLGNAIEYENNPKGEVYSAQFSEKLSGSITFSTSSDGKSITVKLDLSNLPSQSGNYSYHIHDQPVPPNGNCTLTLAHLDPFVRGQAIPCDPKRPQSCEVGDLSGKHGGIPSTNPSYTTTYTDDYITLEQGVGAYIGNRSVVIHTQDTKRFACANITVVTTSGSGSDGPTMKPSYWGCGLGAVMGLKFLLV